MKATRTRHKPDSGAPASRSAPALILLTAIPVAVYLFASLTSLGPVLFTFPRFPDAGVHVGDAVFAVAVAPAWCVLLLRLLGSLLPRAS